MTRTELLNRIKDIHKCHVRSRGTTLLRAYHLDPQLKEIKDQEIEGCGFVEFFNENLNRFSSLESFNNLEKYYKRIRYISKKIKGINQPKQKGLLSFIFGYDELKNKDKIDFQYQELTKVSKLFLNALKDFENAVRKSDNIIPLNRSKSSSESIL